jgi:hypothetical protein
MTTSSMIGVIVFGVGFICICVGIYYIGEAWARSFFPYRLRLALLVKGALFFLGGIFLASSGFLFFRAPFLGKF